MESRLFVVSEAGVGEGERLSDDLGVPVPIVLDRFELGDEGTLCWGRGKKNSSGFQVWSLNF